MQLILFLDSLILHSSPTSFPFSPSSAHFATSLFLLLSLAGRQMSQSSLSPPSPPRSPAEEEAGDKHDIHVTRATQSFPLKSIKRYTTQFLRPAPPFTSLERFLRSKTSYGSSPLVNHSTPLPSMSKSRNGTMPIRVDPGAVPPATGNNTVSSEASVIKGQWTPEEDSLLISLVKEHGAKKWSDISKKLVGRIGKQCRERWHNHLRPDIKKDNWSDEEDLLLVRSHRKLGNRWAKIAKRIPGRTENAIKNHWNATKRRQKSRRKMGKKNPSDIIINRSNISTVLQDYILSLETANNVITSSSSSTETELIRENTLFDSTALIPPPSYNYHGYNGGPSSADSSPVLYQTMFEEPPSSDTMFTLDPPVSPEYCMLMYPNPTSEDTVIGATSESYGLSPSVSDVNYINMSTFMSNNTDEMMMNRERQEQPLSLGMGINGENLGIIASNPTSSSSTEYKRELDLMEMMSMATYDRNSEEHYKYWCNGM
ncbi:hypothetical protein ZOSMA_506G00020 [Zostera marina]|uniref:Uncharacterized protein n=1 Tax=Zostera marina TaxID=29655 RepID=A0A0K9NYD6_ZOSMR|nr:hypothetical protein ZOSMA_506G00020 [Zostera marina]